jgi:hypothetical protein
MEKEFDKELFETEMKAVLLTVHGLSTDIVYTYKSRIDETKKEYYRLGFPLELFTKSGKIVSQLKFKKNPIESNIENTIWHRLKRIMFLSRKI